MSAALVGVIGSAQASDDSQDAEALGNAIESFADRLASSTDALGEYGDLADNLPLTDLAPGDPGGLNLSNLLDQAVGPLATYSNVGALVTAIEGRDGTYGGVTVQFGSGAFAQPAVSAPTNSSITVPIHATRTVNQPLDFEFGSADIAGGSLGVNFVLDTTLSFSVDTNAFTDADSAPATALSLAPPTINLCANASGSVGVFTARFGFTDVKISTDNPNTGGAPETATLHACAHVLFADPDATNGITLDEWTSHALTELAPVASLIDGDPTGNDLQATFYVDASLIDGDAFTTPGQADASITFTDLDLSVGGFDATPTPALGKLDDWDNVNVGDVANGLAQFVASLVGSTGKGDAPLPFLKKSLAETFDAVKPLTDYTAQLTNATVGCGTSPGDADSFPTGLTDNLTTDTYVYCRARTGLTVQSGSVAWTVPGTAPVSTTCALCVNESLAAADPTLGNPTFGTGNPTADVVFRMTAPGNFAIELSFDTNTAHTVDPEPATEIDIKKAIPRPGTAQELFAKIIAAAGLSSLPADLAYSSATKSLTLRLKKLNFNPDPVNALAGFGDLLRDSTNLSGLKDVLDGSGSGALSADVSGINFDVTFGVVLLDDTSDITPLRGTTTATSGTTLTDAGASFLDGNNDPRLGQILKNTNDGDECTIASVTATTLVCATPTTVSWGIGDAYDVDGGLADRFFVKVDNDTDGGGSDTDQPEFSVGDLTAGGTASLKGTVGFLEVSAHGDGAANTYAPANGFPANTVFGIKRKDATKPALSVDINTPNTLTLDNPGGAGQIADAIGVADLLFHLDAAHVEAVCNLKATAGLAVEASVQGNPSFAKGSIAANWPSVFKDDSCEPDLSTLTVNADTDFDANLKSFDPFPSVSGKHNGGDGDTNLFDDTKDFTRQNNDPAAPLDNTKNSYLNLTLNNKTTGASCKIATLNSHELECTLSGGTRAGGPTGSGNQWYDGDEYEVEGNILALLGIIIDNLDKLVEQIDNIAPGETDKEIPLIGISTKELVGKIQSAKQTLDDLRGQPLAEVDCTRNPDGTNTGNDNLGRPFNLEVLPDNQLIYCRAVSTVDPDAVTWTAKVLDTNATLLVGTAVNSLGSPADILDTVGPTPTARVQITVSDNMLPNNDTAIDEWRAMVEFTDAAGNHTAEFPQASPPSSLQKLEELIEDKLGIGDPNVFKLDLLDLPAAMDETPIAFGDADADGTSVLTDNDQDFTDNGDNPPGEADPDVGNLLINKTDKKHCTITKVEQHTLTCAVANMEWDDTPAPGDEFEVVGNGKKDLIVRLGFGFCSADDVGDSDALCQETDRDAPALTVPLNTQLGAAGDLVTLDTEGDLSLDYAARAQLDIGIPLKLDLTPDIVVLDTTQAEVEGRLEGTDLGLSASIGPVTVDLGTAVDTDPGTAGHQAGVGVVKLGADLSIKKDSTDAGDDALDDDIPNNRTYGFTDFFSDLKVDFTGADPDVECQDPANADSTGDACAALDVAVADIVVPGGPIKIKCTASPLSCTPTLPPTLAALINGEPLSWELLLQILPQLLTKLENELDGAAQDVHIPIIGDTLDAGANIVGTFNEQVVTPFADLAAQITATVDNAPNGDGDLKAEPWEVAKKLQAFIYDGADTSFNGLGPSPGVDLILDLNNSGDVTIDDVVVTPLCGDPAEPCDPTDELTNIRDLRITFLLGDHPVDADVPFDIGLRGVPVRLSGGVSSNVDWSVFVDFGLNKDGPYLRTSGPKSFAGGEADALPNGDDAAALDTAITGAENERLEAIVDGGPGDDGIPGNEDDPPDTFPDHNYLQDNDAHFDGDVEPGMWLYNLGPDPGTSPVTGCRIYSVEATILRCDDPTTAADEGVTWHQTSATDGDNYAVVELHPPNEADDGGASELNLTAGVGMGENTAINCTDARHDYPTGVTEPSQLSGFSENRCLAGELAFLAVTIRDKDTGQDCQDDLSGDSEDPTQLCLALKLDVASSDDRVNVTDLISGDIDLLPSLVGQVNIDVRFRTGLNTSQSAGFPSVLGKFHLYWGLVLSTDGLEVGDLAVSFDALNLDAGKFITQFLQPIVKQVKNITGPLMPVIEMLQGEVPIISDLSKLIGQGPVTVLDVLEAVSGNDLSLLRSILQFIRFVNTIPADGNLLIPLGTDPGGGAFSVTQGRAAGNAPLPEDADEGIQADPDTKTNLINDFAGSGSPYDSMDAASDECVGRGSTFGVCGLTFPFLGDASQIFGVLMGKDATLVHYDAGTFGAEAGFDFCFPPILIGPVPVQICIGGSFRVEGRFAIGYDTSGLRKVLEGGTGTHLLDGIFLDDYDANGQEVPEIKFVGTVYAEGAVSVYIFKVGIRGEIIFTLGLDLHEDAPTDGKLRIEEIVSKLANPLCLFDVTGKIEAALSAFVEIDLFITSIEFSIEIVRITLIEFKLDVCTPEPPVLARVTSVAGVESLILHIGLAEAPNRNIAELEINEVFTVRQMESYTTGPNGGKTRFSVTAFGLQQDYFLTTSKVGTANAKLVANADTGDDTVSLLAGSASGTSSTPNAQSPPIPFTLRADQLLGGDGKDELTTGDGNDNVEGGGGDDRIITGLGVDRIRGDAGNDNIDAGEGDDTDVLGGDNDDVINGGKGGDTLQGNAGNDIVSAGPDSTTATSIDDLRGGDGNDTLTADGGPDLLYGDEVLSDCTADGTDTGAIQNADGTGGGDNSDALIGADGADELYGGEENDQLNGGKGNDKLCGGGGNDDIVGGENVDTVEGGSDDDNIVGDNGETPAGGGDSLNGGAGRDYMLGDDGTLTRSGNTVIANATGTFAGNDTMNGNAGDDFMWGQSGTDTMNGNENDDEMRGGPAVDTMNGNDGDDEMYGDDGADVMHGNANNDLMRGGPDIDQMFGDNNTDEMYGDGGADVMQGGGNDDLMRGNGGDDEMEGNGNTFGSSALPLDNADPYNAANFDLHLEPDPTTDNGWQAAGGTDGDVIYGDGEQDDIVGGSQGASPGADGGDTILGVAAQDVIVGDNGDISRPGGDDPDGSHTRSVTLDSPGTGGGADWIQGNDENDDVYAGGGGDLVHGDAGDDYIEGNGGSDGAGVPGGPPVAGIGLYGDTGQDDLIGGTNQGDGGIADGADDIWGGQGHDVIAGDNADVLRSGSGACDGYVCNTFRNLVPAVQDAVIRHVKLWDVDDQAAGDPAAGNSGGDTIDGQHGHDRMYGQGGGDNIKGGANDDFAFGNAGADTIEGGDGQDDLVGGTGRTDSIVPSSADNGRIDEGDLIKGEDNFDSIAGDNARIVRTTDGADDDHGLWVANSFNNAVDRLIALMDIATTDAGGDAPLTNGTSGNDRLLGGDEDDVVYGQGGNDGISGGPEQDLLEGNANGTGNAPDLGTYGADWPVVAGDVIHGDAGADDVGGGTGRIYRMVGGAETRDPASGVDGRKDGADWIAGDDGGDALAGDNTVIERALAGNPAAWILDDLQSPDALDVVRRIMRERDVATTTNAGPLMNGTSGGDTIYGNDGVDVAYGQGGDDTIEGNAKDDHLEGNAGDDTIKGNQGRDDVIGGTGRTFSNDETTAVGGRIDDTDPIVVSPPSGDANDTLHGGDGLGSAGDDDDVVVGDNATVDRELGSPIPTPEKLPFNGTWGPASWDTTNVLRVIRLLDVSRTGAADPETDGTNGADTINGEAGEDVLFGEGGADTIRGDDADMDGADPGDTGADDYIEGNGGADTIRGDLGEDDITGGGSASHSGGVNTLLDANRDGTLDPARLGETLRDAGDLIIGDTGIGTTGDGDVVAGDNARIQRPLASGLWRIDGQRKDVDSEPGAQLRDVVLFDLQKVSGQDGLSADPGESGVDTITGNGGEDILLAEGNGALADAYGYENTVVGAPNCQNATNGPGSGTLTGSEEEPNGDDDQDDLPDLNDPQCRTTSPGDSVMGESGEDYIEGNQGSDNLFGGEGEDDVIGGSSANTGHLNVILPPGDRDTGYAPGALVEGSKPFNLLDGHDVIEGNSEDDTVAGDNAFADRYLGTAGAWLTIAGPGGGGYPQTGNPNPEPARDPWTATNMVRRDVTTKANKEDATAFGNDYVRGGTGKDDVYGLLGNDWLEGNEEEDAIVGDMGKVVDNQLGPPPLGFDPDGLADPSPLNQFIAPQMPFLGSTINYTGMLKREVTLYAFNQSQATVGIGHDVALGGTGNDSIHTGPGEDLANGNAGDDHIWLGDNFTAVTAARAGSPRLAHDRVDAGWGGGGHDHLWGGYGADYLDVRPRTVGVVPGLFPASDPETWFQIAGGEASQNGVVYGQDSFGDIDYIYGGWDQDTLQANEGDNGPAIGDRLLDWGGSYNGYYLCPSTYGDWVSTRAIAPGVIEFLQAMSQGDGATTTATGGSSGFRETAIVFTNEQKDNTKPIHADTPAHFTCGPGTAIP